MFYAQIYRTGEPRHTWSFKFTSTKVFRETLARLNAVKSDRVSQFKYTWKWERWTLVRIRLKDIPPGERQFVKDAQVCDSPEVLLDRIEQIHGFWDAHID